MTLEDKISILFEYFVSKVSSRKDYEFKPHSREKQAIKNFADFLISRHKKSIGPAFLFKYFSFQFEYWNSKETREKEKLAQISWIIGKKAFERWLIKSHDYWYFCKNGVLRLNGIKFSEAQKLLGVERNIVNFVEINDLEELQKNKFFNQKKGFVYCLNNTTLFNDKSIFCEDCRFKENCKNLLGINYPAVFERRGYEKH